MRPLNSIVALASFLALSKVSASPTNSTLTITAISSRDGNSVLECWQLTSSPIEAMSAINFAIGNTTRATWSIIEPRTTVGEAWAPSVQLSMVLNGLIRITAPSPVALNDSRETCQAATTAYFMPGTLKASVLIAADTKAMSFNIGHFTEFPSNEPTVLVQTPFLGNVAPEHVVLHDDPCV